MKRVIAMILFMMFVFSMTGAEGETTVSGYSPMDMCILKEGVYCFTAQDSLLLYESGRVKETVPCPGAYLCDSLSGDVYVLCRAQGSAWVEKYADGSFAEVCRAEVPGEVTGFAVNGDHLCLLCLDKATYEENLYYCDLAGGEFEHQEDYFDVSSLSANEDTIAFIWYDMFGAVLSVEFPQEGLAGIASEYPPGGEIFLVPGEDACLFLHDSCVEYVSWEENKNLQKKYTLEQAGERAYLADTDEKGLHIYDEKTDRVQFVAYDDILGAGSRTLTVANLNVNTQIRLTLAVNEYFTKMHPDYAIDSVTYANGDKMRLALMASDCPADVLDVSIYTCADILRSGVFADLRDFKVIRELEASGDYLDWPFHMIPSKDESLYVLPGFGGSYAWDVNRRLLDRLGLEAPAEDWTWDDLIRIGRQAQEADDSINIMMLNADEMFSQYLLSHIDLITGESSMELKDIEKLLEIYKVIRQEKMVATVEEINNETLFGESIPYAQEGGVIKLENLIMPPRLSADAEPGIRFDGDMLGVYSVSDDKETAAAYIGTYYTLALESPNTVNACQAEFPMFYADPNVYLKNGTGKYARFPNVERTEQVLRFAKVSNFETGLRGLLDRVRPVANKYVNGTVGIEQASKEIKRAVDIWLNE